MLELLQSRRRVRELEAQLELQRSRCRELELAEELKSELELVPQGRRCQGRSRRWGRSRSRARKQKITFGNPGSGLDSWGYQLGLGARQLGLGG